MWRIQAWRAWRLPGRWPDGGLTEGYGHDGPGVCLGDGQTEACLRETGMTVMKYEPLVGVTPSPNFWAHSVAVQHLAYCHQNELKPISKSPLEIHSSIQTSSTLKIGNFFYEDHSRQETDCRDFTLDRHCVVTQWLLMLMADIWVIFVYFWNHLARKQREREYYPNSRMANVKMKMATFMKIPKNDWKIAKEWVADGEQQG